MLVLSRWTLFFPGIFLFYVNQVYFLVLSMSLHKSFFDTMCQSDLNFRDMRIFMWSIISQLQLCEKALQSSEVFKSDDKTFIEIFYLNKIPNKISHSSKRKLKKFNLKILHFLPLYRIQKSGFCSKIVNFEVQVTKIEIVNWNSL